MRYYETISILSKEDLIKEAKKNIQKLENEKLIHYKGSNSHEIWNEYWHEYDENNNCIHYKDSNSHEEWYDENGDKIPSPE